MCADRLDTHTIMEIHDPNLIRAAVVIVLVKSKKRNEASFFLTQRAPHLNKHSGQFALPGGRIEMGENAQSAALRELNEEIGVTASTDQIIGRLDDFPTRSGFCISPFVVWLDQEPKTSLDPAEVNSIYSIPLQDLDAPDIPTLQAIPESIRPVLSIFFPSLNGQVFAPTAAILYQFSEVALVGRCTRVAHYEQPIFAWR